MRRLFFLLSLFYHFLVAGRVQICLNPGHGGKDPGTENPRYGASGPYEKDFNLYIAQVCEEDLVWTLGFSVSMTRINDLTPSTKLSLKKRVKMAKGEIENPYTGQCDTADILINIHNNGHESRAAHGTETYWYADSTLAHYVHTHMFNYISGFPHASNRGLKRRGLYELTQFPGPACYAECAFVTHDTFPNGQWYQLKAKYPGF
ncbi:MAG: N-acetylmuramoyl-L-alanine amidase [candidate division WOR-3 bacterium]